MRLGIFGGSFDPVHYGHLLLAEQCRQQAKLDEVWLLPAAVSPHKQAEPPASPKARLEMLQLALGGHDQLRASSLEIDRGGVSYTVDTLRAVKAQQPSAELFLLMGADTLCDLPNWREPQEILQRAFPLVVCRAGSPQPDFEVLAPLVSAERLAEFKTSLIHMPLIELSSTAIRRDTAAGKSIRYQTPRAVEKYIEAQGLYR